MSRSRQRHPRHPDPASPGLRLWICFAVPEEASCLDATGAHILITGIGPGPARSKLESALARAKPALVLSCGFAGGLNPSLSAGTVLFSADETFPWTSHLTAGGARPGRFCFSERVVCRAAEKRALWRATGADAVEMESKVIRSLCQGHGIPSATLRVISDDAGEDLPVDFNGLLTPDGRVHRGKLFLSLLTRPTCLPGLLRLQRRTRAAARCLAAVLQDVIPS